MANDNTSNDEQISRLKSLAALSSDSSFVMLNINRYKPEVKFPDGETYGAYMSAIEHSVGAIGGSVLWRVPVQGSVVGDLEEFDEVMAVWYPSHQAFLDLPDADRAREMFRYRRVCVEKAHIVELSDQSPSLRPFGS
tara:strand:+ start:285 stop:695 length:411 start_codon:yes stop_codon:yes gene_type:complete